jgi:hypothetical protein
LEVVRDEQLSVNAERLELFSEGLNACCSKSIDYWLEEKDCLMLLLLVTRNQIWRGIFVCDLEITAY